MTRSLLTTSSLIILLLLISSLSFNSYNIRAESCECVAFRLDDVQDYYLDEVNMEIVKVFERKNASLTLGIVGNFFGQDKTLVSFLKDRIENNDTELIVSNHGWNHEDFRRFNVNEQSILIAKTNQKINHILGVTPSTFIAPFDVFDNNTIVALRSNGIKYFSSFVDYDKGPYGALNESQVYHFPSKATTSNNNDTFWWGIKHTETFEQIKSSVQEYGFSVVQMHPYEFSTKQEYNYEPFNVNDTNSTFSYKDFIKNWDKAGADQHQIRELELLIDKLRSEGYKIVLIQDLKIVN